MGQAKQRKSTDPLWGMVRDEQKFRGLVMTCPMEISGSKLFVKQSRLHHEELRYGLLYWDKLVWPSSRTIHFSNGPDESYLASVGVLERPNYTVMGDAAQGLLAGVLKAHQELSEKQPRAWALLEGENSLSYQRDESSPSQALSIELLRCIPIPQGDVPLPEILEFKEKRKDELLLLRVELERLESKAKLSNDPAEFIELSKGDIDKACSDVLKVSTEWQFPIVLADKSFEFSFDVEKMMKTSLAASGTTWLSGIDTMLPGASQVIALAAGVASQFAVSAKPKLVGLKRDLGPYAYAYRMHKELGSF
ncbi:DUF6236 family protein [Pseudomonas kielensis]|uniref:Uncharacterized protein n=1 Tax=Pseudomonas kielensis TaxID=2762577 RepID=A0A7X1KZR1_9PSED|nr:DUF6236 family protein [Pseudomonas kielensis]MBC2692752.1 hypothetical protein [Pseudomonas kielensis]